MLDDLREQANENTDFGKASSIPGSKGPSGSTRILGMTAAQRFIIALLLFLITCLLGSLFLLATGTVVLPIL
jgi:hypothetical protein